MRNPARSDLCTTQSDGKSVHNVHTPKFSIYGLPNKNRVPSLRERGFSLRKDCGRMAPSLVLGDAACQGPLMQ